jgi:iron complex outermembrane receptor protein
MVVSSPLRRIGFGLAGAALIGVAAPAQSQTVASEADPADDEIIVTAQKRAQAAQDVGITLSVLSGEQLAQQGVVSAPDIARVTPGVGVSGSFAGQNVMFSIRGITQQDFQAHAEAPVAVYIDEGYLAANNAAGIGLFDIERVEVLKGPQGTLFGRNATGGLVNITTRRPTRDLTGQGSLSYGSYDEVRAEAAVGGPVSTTVQARVAGLYHRNDGWLENISPTGGDLGGQETVAARGHVAVQPAETVDLLFTGYYSRQELSWAPYTLLSTRSVIRNGVPNSNIVNQPSLFGQPPSDFEKLVVNANNAQDRGAFNTIAGGTFRAEVELGETTLTAITDHKVLRYRLIIDDDASAIDFLDTETTARVRNTSQELRLFHDFGGARLTGGLYYLHIDAATVDLQRLFGLGGVQVRSPFRLKTNSYSAFAQAEVEVAPTVTVVAGLRATREEKEFGYDAVVELLDSTPLVTARTFRGSAADWLYTWKLQAEWRPARGFLLFAGYNRGTKAGSFNAPFAGSATPPDPEVPYKAEKLDAFEIGAKTTLADGLVDLNGSLFYYDYKDFQAFKFVNFATVVTNNPATIKGAEASIDLRPLSGFNLSAGLSYVDAKVEDVPISNALGSAIVTRRPPFTSKWQSTASARYEFPLGGGTASIQGDVQHRSGFFFSLTNFDATRVKAYTLLNARIAWSPDDRWEIAAFARNLTDERYRTVGFDASDFGGFTQVGYGQPRWLGASLSYRSE